MKGLVFVLLLTMLLAAGAAIFLANTKDARPEPRGAVEPAERPGKEGWAADEIALRVASMPLEEKIGQMLIVGFESAQVDDHARRMIVDYRVGGINLLKRNVTGKEQAKQLIADLQDLAEIPLFIAADQEGSLVSRFNFLNELTPQLKIKEPLEAEKIALRRAIELKEFGVNMNFSPVLDYVSDKGAYLYNRTFGTDPDTTGELGAAMINGYLDGGVIPIAKHFPGYGNLFSDPHKKRASFDIEGGELEFSLIPFRKVAAIAPAIMTAHVLIPRIDDKPATRSPKFLGEILRKQMGFDGVVITDDLEMASVGEPAEQAAIDAIKAGADILISTYTPEKQIRIFDQLKKAVLSGEIGEERINESVYRILKLKSLI